MTRVAVVGGSGFIGSHVVAALRRRGVETDALRAPRIDPTVAAHVRNGNAVPASLVRSCVQVVSGYSHVVNAAGISDAAAGDSGALDAANAMLPLILQRAAGQTDVIRFLHVSSSGVRGFAKVLTEDDNVDPVSPYTHSKAWGEELLRDCMRTVVYRPTSVHGKERTVTRRLASFASSPFSVVAGAGTMPTPQVLVENVADGIGFVLLHAGEVPPVVLHPWEGMTVASLLSALGGREPRCIPMWTARTAVRAGVGIGARSARVMAAARRFQMLTMGQAQVPGWLEEQGWNAPLGPGCWEKLGRELRSTNA